MNKPFKSGFCSVIGRPNVGKSTLANTLLGEKIAIVSKKPQTTRNRITCVVTGESHQIVFIDTPGIHRPRSKLGKNMVANAESAMNGMDAILYMVEPVPRVSQEDAYILEKLTEVKTPVFLVINKIDNSEKCIILNVMDEYRKRYGFAELIPISAKTGENTETLVERIITALPEGPMYFPADTVTDQPERQIAAEIIREKALMFLSEEIPHGIAVEVTGMRERENEAGKTGAGLIDVTANVYCEKDSHKGMIIGKDGLMLKRIGQSARVDIEALLGSKIYLELWVKVKKGWRDNDFLLRSFGYAPGKRER